MPCGPSPLKVFCLLRRNFIAGVVEKRYSSVRSNISSLIKIDLLGLKMEYMVRNEKFLVLILTNWTLLKYNNNSVQNTTGRALRK